MDDEATQNQDQVAGEQATDQTTDAQAAESQTDDQTQQQQTEPWWKSRYRSPDEMAEDVRKFQSEADRYKRQVEEFRRQQEPQQQKTNLSGEDFLDRLVKDGEGLFREYMAPLEARIALMDFARAHPDMDSLRAEMASLVQENPAILAHPQGLEMVYNHVKTQKSAVKLQEAATVMQQHKDKVEQTKRTDAFAESSTQPQRQKSAIITPGMSVEDMDKALDEAGIGWISDEERHKPSIEE